MRAFFALWLLNVVLVIDWAKNRRPAFWLFALLTLGPLGGLAYLIYYYEEINFPFPLARTLRKAFGKPVKRQCPRCGQHAELVSHLDGRQHHFMCQTCVEATFMEPHRSWEALEAAESILSDARQDSE